MPSLAIHSPVESLDFPLFNEKKLTVHIKRDDLIHPFISGNKWRKLKYILQDATEQRKSHLVTFGGAWSNHLLATACAGAKFGFNTTAFVRGEAVSNPNLSLCRIFGMTLRFVSRQLYTEKHRLFETHMGGDEQAYFIDEGGYSPLAAKGCGELLDELHESYDHIFCAAGTGTTLAGLAEALAARQAPSRLHGVPVLKGGDFLRAHAADICTNRAAMDSVVLHDGYHFGGYAKTTPELNTFISSFCAGTGILVDPVYTGKLLYSVFDLARMGAFTPGERILVIHTGGLVGILGMHDNFTPKRS